MDNNKAFARRLDDLLHEKRMTAADLSRQTGITEASMSKYRQGKYIPQGQNLKSIAEALGVSTDYLLGDDPMPPKETAKPVPVTGTVIDYELNIISRLPELSDEAKQLLSVTVDALANGNQNDLRILKAYFDALNRLCR